MSNYLDLMTSALGRTRMNCPTNLDIEGGKSLLHTYSENADQYEKTARVDVSENQIYDEISTGYNDLSIRVEL